MSIADRARTGVKLTLFASLLATSPLGFRAASGDGSLFQVAKAFAKDGDLDRSDDRDDDRGERSGGRGSDDESDDDRGGRSGSGGRGSDDDRSDQGRNASDDSADRPRSARDDSDDRSRDGSGSRGRGSDDDHDDDRDDDRDDDDRRGRSGDAVMNRAMSGASAIRRATRVDVPCGVAMRMPLSSPLKAA